MRFFVTHQIDYQYSQPVFIEPMIARLKPRSDARQSLINFDLKIEPPPSMRTEGIDLSGNHVTFLSFSDRQDRLVIAASSEVETLNDNPFDFIFPEEKFSRLPMVYSDAEDSLLQAYQQVREKNEGLADYLQETLAKAQFKTLDFLIALTQRVHSDFHKIERTHGKPYSPSQLLAKGEGACRDLTVFFLETCRLVGLAGRYVSGYTRGDDRLVERELHAWAEIYLPGGGWRGFDPTLGLAVSDQHVAVAASPDPQHTLPTEGTFRGSGAQSEITYQVRVQT